VVIRDLHPSRPQESRHWRALDRKDISAVVGLGPASAAPFYMEA
jgi:cytochrome oxidase assembly protein ShyY1